MDCDHLSAAARICECESHGHLSAHRRVGGLELHRLDHQLISLEPDEASVVGIRVGRGLAHPGRLVVRQGDSELATLAGVERMDDAGHADRHHPRTNRSRLNQRTIDACPWGLYMPSRACGYGHEVLTAAAVRLPSLTPTRRGRTPRGRARFAPCAGVPSARESFSFRRTPGPSRMRRDVSGRGAASRPSTV